MTKIYNDNDLWECYAQRRKILGVFIGITVFYALALVALIVVFSQLPYKDPTGVWYKVAAGVLTAAYIIYAFPYMGICFKRSNAYCKAIKFISIGRKEFSQAPFEGIDDWTTHDGVDVNVALFKEHNRKTDEDMTRQVFIDGEKDFPPFEEGKIVRMVTQGNLLVQYEILQDEGENA